MPLRTGNDDCEGAAIRIPEVGYVAHILQHLLLAERRVSLIAPY